MDVKTWYKKRGLKFVWQRGTSLLNRYGIRANKVAGQIQDCVEALVELGRVPTLFTPGIILERYPQFIRHLQGLGVEIAVHSYSHIDLGEKPVPIAVQQLIRAVRSFGRFGVKNHGFRCPYLDYKEELLDSLPVGMFDYSSNEAIFWDVVGQNDTVYRGLYFNLLNKLYRAKDSSENVCLPFLRSNMLEIPVCVPDDLQLHDGLGLNEKGIEQAWTRILEQTHIRGELFTLIFHTELASFCISPLIELVRSAGNYRPLVWIARLRDISDWWREKSNFKVNIVSGSKKLKLTFDCSPRATILAKGLDLRGSELIWDGMYSKLQSNTLEVPANPRPFIGLSDDIPERIVSFLQEQGYILDTGETAKFCGLILDNDKINILRNNAELVNYIESLHVPLVRYWRWPNGAKSALSLTGDLDALSLMDYASRLFI